MVLTEEDRRRMGQIDPLLAEAVSKQPAPEADGNMLHNRRVRAEHLAKLRHLYPIPGPIPDQVAETNHSVQARDGYHIPIKVYKPIKAIPEPSPIIIMMHEGGWHMGDLTDEDLNCRMFTRDLNAVCINIDYRLAPEHPWPKCVEDCYDVLCWAVTAASRDALAPGDPTSGFIVGGASAGGNLAAVMCQLGRDNGLTPPLTGQYLCVPALMWNDAVPEKWRPEFRSLYESKDPILGEALKDSFPNLAGPGSTNPLLSPLLHPNLKDLPPCYLQVAGLDPLRDEALIWERVLREESKVPTRINVYDGFGHMFWTNWPLLPRSEEFIRDTLEGFKWLLSI